MKITMDRYEANWPMVEEGWRTHVEGKGRMFPSAKEAIEAYRAETGCIDQDLPAFVVERNGAPVAKIANGDSVILFNFRGDRAQEISLAFDRKDFDKFDRGDYTGVLYAGMLQYDGDLKIPSRYLVEPPAITETLTELLDEEVRHKIDLIDSFDEEQIGNRMSTNYVEIPSNVTVKQAMRELIRQAADNDNISTLYIVDENRIFCGAISLNDLIIAREDTNLEDLIVVSYPFVYATEEIADCIEWIKDYSEDSIPVLDEENRIIGVITSQDIVEVVDDEMGEDYAMLAGLTAEEDLEEPLKDSIKKRMPWLIVLLGLGLVVSSVVGMFEHVVAELTIVMCFQSLILDMAGNVGTQSLAVTIRVLMDENLTAGQKVHLVFKEARVGLSNGLILGMMSIILIGCYIYFFKSGSLQFAFAVSGCIGAALILAMLISSLVGTLIPMFFHKIHIDPAVASGPLITTVNDLVAVVTYYGLAWLFLIEMLHY